jgi:hypothetical protein
MCKPSWNDAPVDANYLAQNEDGNWHWFEDEPFADEFPFGCNSCLGEWVGLYSWDAIPSDGPNWTETLEKRPAKENSSE